MRAVNDSRAWTRPRLLLALLLAALVAGAVPVRVAPARRDKPSGTASWRAAYVRPAPLRPEANLGGALPLPAAPLEALALPRIVRADEQRPPRPVPPAPPLVGSPLARAPPA